MSVSSDAFSLYRKIAQMESEYGEWEHRLDEAEKLVQKLQSLVDGNIKECMEKAAACDEQIETADLQGGQNETDRQVLLEDARETLHNLRSLKHSLCGEPSNEEISQSSAVVTQLNL